MTNLFHTIHTNSKITTNKLQHKKDTLTSKKDNQQKRPYSNANIPLLNKITAYQLPSATQFKHKKATLLTKKTDKKRGYLY